MASAIAFVFNVELDSSTASLLSKVDSCMIDMKQTGAHRENGKTISKGDFQRNTSDTAKYTSSSNANHCPVMQRSSHLMPLFQRMVLTGMPLKTFFFLVLGDWQRHRFHCARALFCSRPH